MHRTSSRRAVPPAPADPDGEALLAALTDPARYRRATGPGPGDGRARRSGPRPSGRGGPDGAPGPAGHDPDRTADLVLSGGLAAAVAGSTAACALAERYTFHRVGGASLAAVPAAAVAAAEVGRAATAPSSSSSSSSPSPPSAGARTAPDDAGARPGGHVPPGFAGLAAAFAWALRPAPGGHVPRLVGLLRPAPAAAGLHRLLVALVAGPPERPAARTARIARAAGAVLDRAGRAVVLVLWLGAVLGCAGTVSAVARVPGLPAVVAVVAAVPLAAAFGLAAVLGTALAGGLAVRRALRRLPSEGFALCPGASAAGRAGPHPAPRHQRSPGPALFDWIGDRLDDLAGIGVAAEGTQRYALTFGDLWLGRVGTRSTADLQLLRRAAHDPEQRTVDLVLVAADVSAGRPRLLPFGITDRPGQRAGERPLFCRECLIGLVPVRAVDQMVLMSPPAEAPPECPRHKGSPLHGMPEPWDLPVVFAVRLTAAPFGVLAAVPLYRPDPDGGVRPHLLGDGALTGGVPVHAFDVPLPRWPTFALSTAPAAAPPGPSGPAGPAGPHGSAGSAGDVLVPEQAAGEPPPTWSGLSGWAGLAAGLTGAATGWRDVLQAGLPGLGARLARVRGEEVRALLGDPRAAVRLAVRGHSAGRALVERFGGPDAPGSAHTRTDRLRWMRLRTALAEYRQLSLSVASGMPLFTELALSYRVPEAACGWFSPPLVPGQPDPAWGDAVAAVTHLRSLAEGGVLDWDTDWGTPPDDPHLRLR